MEFKGVSFRLLHNPLPEAVDTYLGALAKAGCNAISVIPHHYVSLKTGTAEFSKPEDDLGVSNSIYADIGQDVTHPFQNTPSYELTFYTIQRAQKHGLTVLLKPHIDSYVADWRGNISVKGKATLWKASYKRFLEPYIDIARQLECHLCIGTELYTVTKELGADFWTHIAYFVRHTRKLWVPMTYAANWGWADDAEYKRLMALYQSYYIDYVGVDAYFPLVAPDAPPSPDYDTLMTGWHRRGIEQDWCPRIYDSLTNMMVETGKPLVFTEIGYGNHQLAAHEPARDARPTDVQDDALQVRLAQAAYDTWHNHPDFMGWFWWEGYMGTPETISHNVLGKPEVEKIVWGSS